MTNKRYSIIFSSVTGNTKLLANAIRDALPQENCDYFGISSNRENPTSELLFIGFWTDKGTADENTLNLLKTLRDKQIFLFGTAGFGGSEEYDQKILTSTKESIDPSNTIVGEYMCQGKMPLSVKERYVKMIEEHGHKPNLDALLENFDSALSHPDANDLEMLKDLVAATTQKPAVRA